MPCIQIKTNVKVNEETAEAIKSQLGKDIALLPEKTEDWLMVTLEDSCRMWFRGDASHPLAIVEVKVFGAQIDSAASEKMTQAVCKLFQKELGVDPKDIYILGGESIYRQFLPYCDTIHLTAIDYVYDADLRFPVDLDQASDWELAEEGEEQTYFDLCYTFCRYVRTGM